MPAPTATRPGAAAVAGGAAGAGTDGRLARGDRTRRRVAEALLGLLDDGVDQPTARQLAERAGVSMRLVFHHFDDMEAVLRSAVAVQVDRHWSRLRPVDPALPRSQRVRRLVRQRATLFEAITPVRRAAGAVERRSPVVAAELAHARRRLREELAAAFTTELAAAGSGRGALLDLLEAVTSWESWDALRRRMGHGPTAAQRLTMRLVDAVLDSTHRPGGAS